MFPRSASDELPLFAVRGEPRLGRVLDLVEGADDPPLAGVGVEGEGEAADAGDDAERRHREAALLGGVSVARQVDHEAERNGRGAGEEEGTGARGGDARVGDPHRLSCADPGPQEELAEEVLRVAAERAADLLETGVGSIEVPLGKEGDEVLRDEDDLPRFASHPLDVDREEGEGEAEADGPQRIVQVDGGHEADSS